MRSSACENAESAGPHATSNIFGATSAAVARPARFGAPALDASPEGKALKAGRDWRRSVTDARTMSSRSRTNASARRRCGVGPPRPKAPPMDWASWLAAVPSFAASFSRSRSSSAKVMGASLMRSKISSRNAPSRSAPLQMPRLLRRKPSLVIFFSSLTAGLCKSVWSMITENARTNATSADGKTALFNAQYRSAYFSIMRSIFWASPGRRKPLRKWRMATSNSKPVKSIASTYSWSTLTQKPSWYASSLPR
mmetsp:Transcript_9999/g.34492  ORF Transcript_9999/g.34492 Transcript_9999/m.34492 type:complete len:252 (-) Transcript_9999:301-1056(-)